jgi:hypothetical protein
MNEVGAVQGFLNEIIGLFGIVLVAGGAYSLVTSKVFLLPPGIVSARTARLLGITDVLLGFGFILGAIAPLSDLGSLFGLITSLGALVIVTRLLMAQR